MAKIQAFLVEFEYIDETDAVNTEDAKTAILQELNMQKYAGDRPIFVYFESETVSITRVVCVLEDY